MCDRYEFYEELIKKYPRVPIVNIHKMDWQEWTEVQDYLNRIVNCSDQELLNKLFFVMEGAPRHEYLEFRMYLSPVTEETVLEITDFTNEKEVDDLKRLWDSQIKNLRQETGG